MRKVMSPFIDVETLALKKQQKTKDKVLPNQQTLPYSLDLGSLFGVQDVEGVWTSVLGMVGWNRVAWYNKSAL